MKKLILISLFICTLNAFQVWNHGATVTIGEGVTLRFDETFYNEGDVINYGTIAIGGQFAGWSYQNQPGGSIAYFSDANISGSSYENLIIEGNNTVNNNSLFVINLDVLGNLNLSGNIVLTGHANIEGTISGSGHIQGYLNYEINPSDYINATGLGLIVKKNGPGEVTGPFYMTQSESWGFENNVGLNQIFETDILFEDSLSIGFELNEQNLNGMDLEKLSIFYNDSSGNWVPLGGEVSQKTVISGNLYSEPENATEEIITVIMIDNPPSSIVNLEDGTERNNITGYFTVGQVGCVVPGAANYDPMAFGGEYECTYNYAEEFNIGYNLISFYAIDNEDNSVDNVLETLDMATDVIAEGQATTIHPILGWIGSLTSIDRNKGYWVKLFESDTYELENGTPNRTDMTYELHSGQNLISYSGPSETPVGDAISSESSCDNIIGQGVAATFVNGLGWIGSLSNLEPWGGYWINCLEGETFEFEGHGALPRPVIPIEIPEFLSFQQSPRQAFYFIESIEDAIEGRDFLISKKGDDILGVVAYTEYAAVPAMGAFEDVVGYEVGEQVSLQLYNSDTDLYYYLNGQDLAPWNDLEIHMVGTMTMIPVIPEGFNLHNAYPNPFNPVSNIQFDLPEDIHTNLAIYDISGRLVETLIAGDLKAGYYNITWDASGKASGMYLLKLHAGDFIETQKITLLK